MKQIRIGNQTAFSATKLTLPFEYAIANGFDSFEWFPDKNECGTGWDISDIDRKMRSDIKESSLEHDIKLSVHAPWDAISRKPITNKTLSNKLKFAHDIGASLINIHLYTDDGLESYVKAIASIIKGSAEIGIKLSIENTPFTDPEDFNKLFTILWNQKEIKTDHVGMCLDIGHANLCSSTRNDYLLFIDRIVPEVPIIHIHLHENYGDHDSHLPLFSGPAKENDAGISGLIERLHKRKFHGSIILEQWPVPPSLLNEARNRLYQFFDLEKETSSRSTLSKKEELQGNANSCTQKPETPEALEHEIDFVDKIIISNQKHRSWREKLSWICSLFLDESFGPRIDYLVYISIYLRFLSTGAVTCCEDSQHFRPNHHAKISRQIHERLFRIANSDNAFIIRKIYPLLPSYARAFTTAEPLTRIRDIAHRNDIPAELKCEIKHSLQNKLHRCAGPEDLTTSNALLERITSSDANYSSDFVEEFKIFHEEIKEFFNATSLCEQLERLIKHVNPHEANLISEFQIAKGKNEARYRDHITLLELLTELRISFIAKVKDNKVSEVQQIRLAEIGLEDFGFVALSQLINCLEAEENGIPWSIALSALTMTIMNLRLSEIFPIECGKIESELGAWNLKLDLANNQEVLRLKASLDRCRRLANKYTDRVQELFAEKVERLGGALHVPEHVINLFCEGDVRGNLVFQLSRLVSGLLKNIKKIANLSPWDILITGKVIGHVVFAEYLDDLEGQLEEASIVVLKNAKGDELIPNHVVAIILGHELPHLSHLGVRARRAGIVFVACEDDGEFNKLESLKREWITLDVSSEALIWKIAPTCIGKIKEAKDQKLVHLPDVHLATESKVLTLDQVTMENGGAKAYAAKQLRELSVKVCAEGQDNKMFKTPEGLLVPYGMMEQALKSMPEVEKEYHRLLNQLNELSLFNFKDVSNRICDLIGGLKVGNKIIREIIGKFLNNESLIVRSSATFEDVEGVAGAGLYDSILSVLPSELDCSITNVWASLWTQRAATSRRECDIHHNIVHMAVLIQEMLKPDYSFVIHTVNPVNHKREEIYIELAAGHGEVLASGAVRGTPYRMVCNKHTEEVRMLAFANFSQATYIGKDGKLSPEALDYSNVKLSTSDEYREKLGKRLTDIGQFVEGAFKKPQDIEGAVVGDDIFLVQSRPQQGVY